MASSPFLSFLAQRTEAACVLITNKNIVRRKFFEPFYGVSLIFNHMEKGGGRRLIGPTTCDTNHSLRSGSVPREP